MHTAGMERWHVLCRSGRGYHLSHREVPCCPSAFFAFGDHHSWAGRSSWAESTVYAILLGGVYCLWKWNDRHWAFISEQQEISSPAGAANRSDRSDRVSTTAQWEFRDWALLVT